MVFIPKVIEIKETQRPCFSKDELVTIREVVMDCSGCPINCCQKFKVPLSPYEMYETPLKHDEKELSHTGLAVIAKGPDGNCAYHTGTGCGIWETRPNSCRQYSCLDDCRVKFN